MATVPLRPFLIDRLGEYGMRLPWTTILLLLLTLAVIAPAFAQQSTPFDYGVVVSLPGQDGDAVVSSLAQLGVNWVKHEIPWRDIEPVQGQINFALLDSAVNALDTAGFQILLTVTTAPDWARGIQEESGPPDDFATFGTFVGALASRYSGRVDAYEIWSEPNLRSRWKSLTHPIGAQSYTELLAIGYEAIKATDPAAVVISAGLASTGFNDAVNAQAGDLEVNAIDDRIFLENLYAVGFAQYRDAVGVNAMGWANPPDSRCCEAAAGVSTHFEDPHFYFLNTLEEYHTIMVRNGDTTPLWVTSFGWGTTEDMGTADPLNEFMTYTDLNEQGRYARRAFEIGYWLDFVGPMFLYNLNACVAPANYDSDACYYSLIGPEGTPRPVFESIASVEKVLRAAPTATPVPTATQSPSAEPQTESTPEAES